MHTIAMLDVCLNRSQQGLSIEKSIRKFNPYLIKRQSTEREDKSSDSERDKGGQAEIALNNNTLASGQCPYFLLNNFPWFIALTTYSRRCAARRGTSRTFAGRASRSRTGPRCRCRRGGSGCGGCWAWSPCWRGRPQSGRDGQPEGSKQHRENG